MVENVSSRGPRSTRSNDERKQVWKPASMLPVPAPREGVEYRWVRATMVGRDDNRNVSMKMREGWVPVQAKDHPELMVMNDRDSRFPENIEIGGLVLCANSTEMMDQRRAHQQRTAERQIEGVDQHYLRDNDPRMPKLRPERSTRVSKFGTE